MSHLCSVDGSCINVATFETSMPVHTIDPILESMGLKFTVIRSFACEYHAMSIAERPGCSVQLLR